MLIMIYRSTGWMESFKSAGRIYCLICMEEDGFYEFQRKALYVFVQGIQARIFTRCNVV